MEMCCEMCGQPSDQPCDDSDHVLAWLEADSYAHDKVLDLTADACDGWESYAYEEQAAQALVWSATVTSLAFTLQDWVDRVLCWGPKHMRDDDSFIGKVLGDSYGSGYLWNHTWSDLANVLMEWYVDKNCEPNGI